MNGLQAAKSDLIELAAGLNEPATEILICPPTTAISTLSKVTEDTPITLGAQDCHTDEKGAHTGDISAEMLADAGAAYVIVGHSERRADHGETDAVVRAKTLAVWRAGLTAIICVGESEAAHHANKTLDIIGAQLAASLPDRASGENLVVAYEPIWAIGTGLVPTLDDIGAVHDFIRQRLTLRFGADTAEAIRLLYGGSMNPGNAADIIAVENVDGGLVGGASLKARDFGQIIDALNG